MILIILYLLFGLLIGAIPTGLIIGKIKKVDIRNVGSKNIGATNVTRALGPFWGLITLIIDSLKAFLILFFFGYYINFAKISISVFNIEFWTSILAILVLCGNTFNPFMKFKGGKGVATGLGIMLFLNPKGVAISFIIFLIIVIIFRYISLGSIFAVIAIILTSFFFTNSIYTKIAIILIGLIVIYRHKENIKRLLNSTENKFTFKKNDK